MSPNQVTNHNQGTVLLNLYKKQPSETKKRAFSVGDVVIVSREKQLFEKGYAQNWGSKKFQVSSVQKTVPVTYNIKTLDGEGLKGGFYQSELSTPPEV